MRLALISDIHSNIHALTAAFKYIAGQAVDQVLIVGDLVGYGASPGAVIDLARSSNYLICMGSSDMRVAMPFAAQQQRQGQAETVIKWTRDILDEDQVNFLKGLPVGGRITTPAGRLRFFHGHPQDPEQKLDLSGGEGELMALMKDFPARIVVAAGTHVPFTRRIGDTFFIDPGSVGLSLNGEAGADVTIIDCIDDSPPRIYSQKVPYDTMAAAFDVLAWQLPMNIANVIKNGST